MVYIFSFSLVIFSPDANLSLLSVYLGLTSLQICSHLSPRLHLVLNITSNEIRFNLHWACLHQKYIVTFCISVWYCVYCLRAYKTVWAVMSRSLETDPATVWSFLPPTQFCVTESGRSPHYLCSKQDTNIKYRTPLRCTPRHWRFGI